MTSSSSSCNFRCEYPECMKEYGSYNNLLRHYREYKEHRPVNLENKRKPNAQEIVNDVLLSDNISQTSRSARVHAFVSCLSDNEIKEHFLQRAVSVVSPLEFLLAKNTSKMQSVNTTKLYRDFVALRESIFKLYPEMKQLVADSFINSPHINNVNDMVKFVLSNQNLLCKALLEAENGEVLREKLMPLVLEKYQEHFVEFASGIVGSFCLGQKQLQDVLRNRWGNILLLYLVLMSSLQKP